MPPRKRKQRPAPTSLWRPGDLPEPVEEPTLLAEYMLSSNDWNSAQQMLAAAAVFGFDITVDTYHGLVDDKGTTRHGIHVRVWKEQIWSAHLGPREEPTNA